MPSSPALASATRQSSSLHWRGSSGSASDGWRRVNDAPMNPGRPLVEQERGQRAEVAVAAGPRIQRGSGARSSTQCPRGAQARIAASRTRSPPGVTR